MRDRIIGPIFILFYLFFSEKTVSADTCLDMLQLYAMGGSPSDVSENPVT